MGANGAGKTTLLRCLATATPPSTGRFVGFAATTHQDPASPLFGIRGARQLPVSAPDRRRKPPVRGPHVGAATDSDRVDARLSEAGLAGAGPLLCGRLSQGMRRRVSILRAIVHDPAIVLLDEPSTGLDQRGQGWLARILRKLKDRHCCICFVTHERQLVTDLADRVLELREGRAWEAPAHGVEQRLAADSCKRVA